MATGALATPPTEANDQTRASPTVGKLAEGDAPDPGEQVPDDGVPGIGSYLDSARESRPSGRA
jgi:hypothetical protein